MSESKSKTKKTQANLEADAAWEKFLEALSGLNTLEVNWAFGMLFEKAQENIKHAEMTSMLHRWFKREQQAVVALERIPFYQKLIKLRELWFEFEMHKSAPSIIESITGGDGKRKS